MSLPILEEFTLLPLQSTVDFCCLTNNCTLSGHLLLLHGPVAAQSFVRCYGHVLANTQRNGKKAL